MAGIKCSKPKKLPYINPKKHGKQSAKRNNSRDSHMLKPVEQIAAKNKAGTLAHIAKHDSKHKSIGQCHKLGRIQFIVSRQAVHTDKHLKRFEDTSVFQLCRRTGCGRFIGVLDEYIHSLIVSHLLLEMSCIPWIPSSRTECRKPPDALLYTPLFFLCRSCRKACAMRRKHH